MKPHGTIKGRSRFPAQHPVQHGETLSVDHVLERIKTLTGELEAVQAEIYGQINEPGEMLARRSLLEEAGAAQVLEHFKTALDHIRSVLWLWIEEAAAGGDPHRKHQLAHASELLRSLSHHSDLPAATSRRGPSEPVSFFDRLDRVIDSYMQESGTLVDPTPGKPRKP